MSMPGGSIGALFVELDLDPSRYMRSQQQLLRDAQSTSLNIEQNFKNLGIHSSAEFDLMRAKIINSYNMISHSSKATANDIIRVEQAKNQKLQELNEQQFGKQESLLATLKAHWIEAGAAIYAAMRFERMVAGWVELSNAQDQAERQLKAAQIANGRYSESFYQSTLKQAEALHMLTGAKEADIERGQRMLMTYENISNDIMPRATKAMADLAAIMGGDMQKAAEQLGKAMEGESEGLRRAGIVISKDVYTYRGAIGVLEEVEKKVKGQSESLAQGSGQWKLLGGALNDAKIALGHFFTELATNTKLLPGLILALNTIFHPPEDTASQKYAEQINHIKELNNQLVAAKGNLEAYQQAYKNQNTPDRGSLFGGSLYNKAGLIKYQAEVRFTQEQITTELNRMADDLINKRFGKQVMSQTKSHEQLAEESMKNIMDNASRWGIKDSQADDKAKEIAKALEEVNDAIAKSTLTPYQLEVYELDKKFKGFRETLGDTPKVMEAYGLALDALNRKFADVFRSGLYSRVFDDSLFGKALKDARDNGKSISLGNFGFGSLPPSQGQWTNLGFSGFSTTLDASNKIADQELERRIKLELEQYAGMQKELEENYKYFSDLQVKEAEESRKIWDNTAKSLESSFMDAFDNIYKDGAKAFSNLGKNIQDTLIHAINKQVFEKPLESLADGITGLFSDTTRLGPIDPITGLPTIVGSKGALAGAAPYIGAGAMGYGVGQMTGQSGVGMGLGAISGYYLGGPAGAIAGGMAGGFIENLFGLGKDTPRPEVNLVYKAIDGEIKKVSESWEDMGRDSGLVNSVSEFFDSQISFYDHLSVITGQKMADLSFSLSGWGSDMQSQLEGGMNAAVLKMALANYGQLSTTFGPEFSSDFETLYGKMFKQDRKTSPGMFPGPLFTYPSLEEVADNPDAINNILKKYNMFDSPIADRLAKNMSGELGQEWKDLLQPFIDQLNEIWGDFSSGLGGAFLGSLSTGEFQDFEQQFKASIFKGVSESMTEAFLKSAMESVMGPESGIFSSFSGAQNLLKDYIAEKEGVTIQDVLGGYATSFTDINNVMEELKPVWTEINTGMQNLAQVLGLNTVAIQRNTKVNSFLQSLDTGPLAPFESSATLERIRGELYTKALADPDEFGTYAQFMSSRYLPNAESTSVNYAGVVSNVRSDVTSMPWYNGNNAVADLSKAFTQAVGPMILDLKESAKITVNFMVDGQLMKTVIVDSVKDPAVAGAIADAVGVN